LHGGGERFNLLLLLCDGRLEVFLLQNGYSFYFARGALLSL